MVLQEQNPLIKVNIKNDFHLKGGVVNALKSRCLKQVNHGKQFWLALRNILP